jgi:hypothetical protein
MVSSHLQAATQDREPYSGGLRRPTRPGAPIIELLTDESLAHNCNSPSKNTAPLPRRAPRASSPRCPLSKQRLNAPCTCHGTAKEEEA